MKSEFHHHFHLWLFCSTYPIPSGDTTVLGFLT